jgi:hypothetical protein
MDGDTSPSTSSPLIPSPLLQANPISVEELLAPSFLLQFGEILPSSYTIWDYYEVELNAIHDGGKLVAFVKALLLAFEPLLAPEVISQIRKTLDVF